MTRILVADVCQGSRVSRRDGEALRTLLESHWDDGEPVVLDFKGVVIASVSFFDESLGVLALRHSLPEVTRRIKVEHLQAGDRKLLNTLVLARQREREARAGSPEPHEGPVRARWSTLGTNTVPPPSKPGPASSLATYQWTT